MRRLTVVLVASAALIATNASPAGAAVTIGQTFTPNSACGGDTFFQRASLGQQYSAPSPGVITTWAFQANSAPPPVKFKVGRPAGGNDYTIVGASDSVNPTPDVLNTYPTRISVQAGDQIGFFVVAFGACAFEIAPTGNLIAFFNADLSPGVTETFDTQDERLLDISATLEPDCDSDGFGDETQDPDTSSCKDRNFSFGELKRNKKKGTATLTVNVPGPGELTGSGNGARVASVGRVRLSKSVGAGAAHLLIKAKGKKRKKLNARGKVKLSVAVTYTPTGGQSNTRSVRVKLKRKL